MNNSSEKITKLWFDHNITYIPDGWSLTVYAGNQSFQIEGWNMPNQDFPLEFETPMETIRFHWLQVSTSENFQVFIQFLFE